MVRTLRERRLARLIGQLDHPAADPSDARRTALVGRAKELAADDVDLTLRLASALADSDRTQAQHLGERAATQAPEDPLTLLRVAGLMFSLERYEAARAYLSRSQALAPIGFALHANQQHLDGRLTAHEGDPTRALQLLTAAFDEDPEFPEHATALIAGLCKARRLTEAGEVLDRALRARPDDELIEWRTYLDRGAPPTIWGVGLKLRIEPGSPIDGHPAGTWWAFAHAHDETQFLTLVTDAAARLDATVLATRDLSSIDRDADPRALADWPQQLSLNDVEFLWRDDDD